VSPDNTDPSAYPLLQFLPFAEWGSQVPTRASIFTSPSLSLSLCMCRGNAASASVTGIGGGSAQVVYDSADIVHFDVITVLWREIIFIFQYLFTSFSFTLHTVGLRALSYPQDRHFWNSYGRCSR